MRLTTDFFVTALVRKAFADGGFAAIVKRGAMEAGAVFVTVRGRTGETTLYGPAPQTSYDDRAPADRQFQLLASAEDQSVIEDRLVREMRFDPDLWVVEIEPSSGDVGSMLSLTTP